MQSQTNSQTPIAIYQSAAGSIATEVRLEGERTVIAKHLRNVFAEGELDEKSNVQNLHIAVIRNFRIVARKREVRP